MSVLSTGSVYRPSATGDYTDSITLDIGGIEFEPGERVVMLCTYFQDTSLILSEVWLRPEDALALADALTTSARDATEPPPPNE